ncbi:hypothetical protein EON81_10270 [bacterium]|nr:MAG: hypothetical protein EON81_10270 [bacterium]
MDVQVIQMDPIRVVMLRHVGPYEGLSDSFETLYNWVEKHGVPAGRMIGIYWDNPEFVPANQLKSAACVEVPVDYLMNSRDGLNIQIDELAGGSYATTRFVGPYDKLEAVWAQLTNHVEGNLRREISENPAFEVYVNDPSDTPENALITELFMPLV